MKIPLVGPSYQQRSLPFDAQRTINLYPVMDKDGKEVAALYGTPGLTLFATAGNGPIRGAFTASNGRAFVVSSLTLYEVNSDGTTTSRGTLDNNPSVNVMMDENGLQLAICDEVSLYIFTFSTNVFAKVTDADLPSCGTVTFTDGYFAVNKNNSGQFFISAQYDGTSWNALDFATAESSPDNLSRVLNAIDLLWLFGTETTEVWRNSGAADFPFEKISGAKMQIGILAPHSALALDNSVFWVGKDDKGQAIVYRAQGFYPLRISTDPIEKILQAATSASGLRGYSYQQEGHLFYVITGGGLPTTLVYDVSTQLWHERAYLNDGNFEQHLGSCGFFAFSKNLVGSRRDGSIYQLSLDVFDDNGDPMASERTFTHLSDENRRIRFNQLELAMETGVGNQSDPGSNPLITLWTSRDGARTWSNSYTKPIGKVGVYGQRVAWRRLGIAPDMVFRVRITDPVKRSLIGSYLK